MRGDLGDRFWCSHQQDQLETEKKERGITNGMLKCIEPGPFSSHWMAECITFAKAKQLQTLFLKVCVALKRNKSFNLMCVRK